MSVESIFLCLVYCALWLVNKIRATFSTNDDRALIARVFPRLRPVQCVIASNSDSFGFIITLFASVVIGQSISLVFVLWHNLKLLNNNHMTNNPNSNKINIVKRTLNMKTKSLILDLSLIYDIIIRKINW